MEYNTELETRFWSKVDIRGPDECWPWKGGLYGKGYGSFHLEGRAARAHRVAFELFYHRKPGKSVLHKCENKICVNPHHLYEGDNVANARDLHVSGGGGTRKLSAKDVREIKRLHKTGQYLQRELGTMFGCSRRAIGNVLSGQTYYYV